MSVYLYNVAFSLNSSDTILGRFQQYNSSIGNPSIANQSSAWFEYMVAGTPNGMGDYFQPITTALTATQWGNSSSDGNALSLNPGDYVIMRVFCNDANAANYRVRVTGVFGRGDSSLLTGGNDLQSPLVMSTPTAPSTYPRAVIDVDGCSGSSWPGPITTDNSWVNWLGMVHATSDNEANDYSLNIGVSVYYNGATYTFGKDPHMHVGTMRKRAVA